MTLNPGRAPGPANPSATQTALEELIRRAKLQARELSGMIQRLEQLRRDIDRHLPDRTR